nr:MAG TPA: hypothetical protein [Caudoviricetes sp.]
MNDGDKHYRMLKDLISQGPVSIAADALLIFLPCDHKKVTLEENLATICRNLMRFYLCNLLHEFSPYEKLFAQGLDEPHSRQLLEYFVSHEAVSREIALPPELIVSPAKTKAIFAMAESFPQPPESIPARYDYMHCVLREVLKIRFLPKNEAYIRLYKISAHWTGALPSIVPEGKKSGFPVVKNAIKYLFQHRRRHEAVLDRSVEWGAEYESYLQKSLRLGYRPKTAKFAAKRDFIAVHPLNGEDSCNCPGLSNPAIKRYHEAYLNSIR